MAGNPLDDGEMNIRYPRRSRDVLESFADLDLEELGAEASNTSPDRPGSGGR